ncbi:hypothetical protein OEZ86_007813 [Tetradesmus obliquus]|nr:hypothetical protein OEZ86_007813 [Tetradesmus obliquus]
MRHERDRSNRRQRLQQLKATEEAQLAELPEAARAAYEAEATTLRIAAAKQQQADLQHALQHGLKRAAADSSREVRSLAKQIELSVSLNRRSSQPVALTVTSFTGHLATSAQHMGANSWPINKHTEHVLQLLPPEQLVVLSPDADEPLQELKPNKVYVIGGIVDRSVCKGLTAGFGVRHGVQTVRLPVAEYAGQLGLGFAGASTRPVLTVSDVVVALVEFNRTGDWVHALQQALPARKRRGSADRKQQTQAVVAASRL